ncbi:TPA: WG repeat-containing protein [Campylobacter lari]|uniref:WG repeat-containing protein n=1 Tax=Campylobacter TaxID=194 RepID=UPI000E185699|nr:MULTISPECIES: WG repeat-containing protein [Campylobacter]EAL5902254.1 WG repeat-containing protein [Campylobacter lari]MCV3462479.1 WG repeat-containing protein [Campylobacter sp. FU_497]SUX05547.1 KWG Leptospira repeat protein [Campylobacter lari]HEC1759660.1 WG repeat-containing protein [Campylobacter lari]
MFKAIFQFLSDVIKDINSDKIWDSRDGICKTRTNGKYGFMDDKGKVIISPCFDAVYDFSEGLALVELNNKYGYINKNGEIVIDLKFELAYPFHKGYAKVKIKKKWGVINKDGDIVLQPVFDSVLGLDKSGKAFFVTFKGATGFIDKNGNFTELY